MRKFTGLVGLFVVLLQTPVASQASAPSSDRFLSDDTLRTAVKTVTKAGCFKCTSGAITTVKRDLVEGWEVLSNGEKKVQKYINGILDALDALDRAGLLPRDFKPNIDKIRDGVNVAVESLEAGAILVNTIEGHIQFLPNGALSVGRAGAAGPTNLEMPDLSTISNDALRERLAAAIAAKPS